MQFTETSASDWKGTYRDLCENWRMVIVADQLDFPSILVWSKTNIGMGCSSHIVCPLVSICLGENSQDTKHKREERSPCRPCVWHQSEVCEDVCWPYKATFIRGISIFIMSPHYSAHAKQTLSMETSVSPIKDNSCYMKRNLAMMNTVTISCYVKYLCVN